MIHSPHRLRIYHRRHHVASIVIAILFPALFLGAAAALGRIYAPDIFGAIGITLFRVLTGYALSLIVGVGLAVLFGGNRFGETLLPFFDVLQNVPSFALIPLFAAALGYSSTMAILFAATSIVWPILFYTIHAIHSARRDLADAAQVFGARGGKRVLHFLLPLSFPAVITGSLVGISIGWEAVIGVELVGFREGVGALLTKASATHDTITMFSGIAGILLVVFVINRLIWIPLIRKTQRYAE